MNTVAECDRQALTLIALLGRGPMSCQMMEAQKTSYVLWLSVEVHGHFL